MTSRRAFVAGAATVGLLPLTGCADVLSGSGPRHYIDVMNGGDDSHSFAVTVYDTEDAVLFEHTYELTAGEGDENRVIDGVPAHLEVAVDGGEPVELAWSPLDDPSFTTNRPDGCPDGTTPSLRLWYAQKTADDLDAFYSCETVR